MKKIITVVGARPQFIKAAAISRSIREDFADELQEFIIHTGQHYDPGMSEVFFNEMGIPREDLNLNVGSGSHGGQTAEMLKGIENAIVNENPDALLVYGDTNSTLAGALAAAKLHVPVVHIEAGLRSFNKRMPEEVNRITADHCSSLMFVPTKTGIDNLKSEGFDVSAEAPYGADNPGVFLCGDVMYDNSLYFRRQINSKQIVSELGLEGGFALATIHRPSNTDAPENLESIFRAMNTVANEFGLKIALPLHPRTGNILQKPDYSEAQKELNKGHVKLLEPASYLHMLALENEARIVLTDSGGVQKEAFFFEKPCVIMREQTEWVELVENGNAILAGADFDAIVEASRSLLAKADFTYPDYYGDGFSARDICQKIAQYI